MLRRVAIYGSSVLKVRCSCSEIPEADCRVAVSVRWQDDVISGALLSSEVRTGELM